MRKKPQPPVTSAATASALALLAVTERVPEVHSQLAVTVQQPARRSEEADEIHQREAEYRTVTQGQVQAPPPVVQALPPGQQLFEQATRRDDSWWRTAADTAIPRNAALLDYLSRTPVPFVNSNNSPWTLEGFARQQQAALRAAVNDPSMWRNTALLDSPPTR
jgi:hypothetical protein